MEKTKLVKSRSEGPNGLMNHKISRSKKNKSFNQKKNEVMEIDLL